MQWKAKTPEQRRAHEWRMKDWFAWHPVEIDGQWVWLEWVQRQKVFMGLYIHVAYRRSTNRTPS